MNSIINLLQKELTDYLTYTNTCKLAIETYTDDDLKEEYQYKLKRSQIHIDYYQQLIEYQNIHKLSASKLQDKIKHDNRLLKLKLSKVN